MARRVPLGGTYNICFRAYIDAGEPTPIERILFHTGATYKIDLDSTTKVERSLHVLGGAVAVFGSGFKPPSETFCSGTDTYGPPLLAVVNKMSDVVDTKPLAKRSTDLAWMPAVGPWDDVEREQVEARPARGPAGPALQLPARDRVRPSSQLLPHDEDRGPGGVPHINVGIIGHVDHGKTTLITALLQLLADQRPDNFVAFDPIDKAPQEREGDFFAAAPVLHYVPGMGAPGIGLSRNKCDMVEDLDLRGRVEPGSAPAWPQVGRDHAPCAAVLYDSAVGTGLPSLGSITAKSLDGLKVCDAEFWTGYTLHGHTRVSLPASFHAEHKSNASVFYEVLVQPIEREAHAACEVGSYSCNGDSGVEPEPGGLARDIASVASVNTSVFNQTNNPTHNILRQPSPLLGDLNRYLAGLVENFQRLQPYVNVGACGEHDPHPSCAQRDIPGHADDLQRMITCATQMDGASRTQPERITPPNKMPTQPWSGEGPLPGTFFKFRRGS